MSGAGDERFERSRTLRVTARELVRRQAQLTTHAKADAVALMPQPANRTQGFSIPLWFRLDGDLHS